MAQIKLVNLAGLMRYHHAVLLSVEANEPKNEPVAVISASNLAVPNHYHITPHSLYMCII